MTVKEMLALGWGPSEVTSLRWNCDGIEIDIRDSNGVHGIVVPGSNFVAVLRGGNETHPQGQLTILSSDGSVHGKLENRVSISGREFRGVFSWFETAITPFMDTFGVIFQTDEGGSLRCDVDARKPSLVNAVKVQ